MANATGDTVPVEIGIRVDQIVGIDQKAESFRAVYEIVMRWQDAKLAYDQQPDDEPFRMLTLDEFLRLGQKESTRWPQFTLANQQGRLDASSQVVLVAPEGVVTFFERATATFQAPDFDFRRFPFDHQTFHIRVRLALPEGFYRFVEFEGLSGMGEQLGEEEWVIKTSGAQIISQTNTIGLTSSEFVFTFNAHRHTVYYLARLFIPMLIILMVSWATFQLKDYVKRVDVGITNLLLFIAFNFTVSSDLPRLGYATAMDAFMTGAFITTGLVVLVNIYFRRMQLDGHEERAAQLDKIAVRGYWPAYILGMSVALFLI